MKIAILYICTGKYHIFFKDFYESCERYFIEKAQKQYFVFTDNEDLITNNARTEGVRTYYKKCEGFPMDSLFRFDQFLRVKEELKDFDYAYFFNSNMLFVAPIDEEFLPSSDSFTALVHPGYNNRPSWIYPYERNKKSRAYISPYNGPYTYYMGSLNGGSVSSFIKFAEVCSKNVHEDYDDGIIAVFHDESHLNHYMKITNGKAIPSHYVCAEGSPDTDKAKIIIRDKTKYDKYFTKGHSYSAREIIINAINRVWRAFRWYLFI